MRQYRTRFFEARGRIPDEYSQISARPHTGYPGILYARSFAHPGVRRSLNIARSFQRNQLAFMNRICDLIDEFDENFGDGSEDKDEDERSSSQWRRLAPFLERDLRRG